MNSYLTHAWCSYWSKYALIQNHNHLSIISYRYHESYIDSNLKPRARLWGLSRCFLRTGLSRDIILVCISGNFSNLPRIKYKSRILPTQQRMSNQAMRWTIKSRISSVSRDLYSYCSQVRVSLLFKNFRLQAYSLWLKSFLSLLRYLNYSCKYKHKIFVKREISHTQVC